MWEFNRPDCENLAKRIQQIDPKGAKLNVPKGAAASCKIPNAIPVCDVSAKFPPDKADHQYELIFDPKNLKVVACSKGLNEYLGEVGKDELLKDVEADKAAAKGSAPYRYIKFATYRGSKDSLQVRLPTNLIAGDDSPSKGNDVCSLYRSTVITSGPAKQNVAGQNGYSCEFDKSSYTNNPVFRYLIDKGPQASHAKISQDAPAEPDSIYQTCAGKNSRISFYSAASKASVSGQKGTYNNDIFWNGSSDWSTGLDVRREDPSVMPRTTLAVWPACDGTGDSRKPHDSAVGCALYLRDQPKNEADNGQVAEKAKLIRDAINKGTAVDGARQGN
jgi:hypothetical protein